jgi:hypothetical protein
MRLVYVGRKCEGAWGFDGFPTPRGDCHCDKETSGLTGCELWEWRLVTVEAAREDFGVTIPLEALR